MGHCLRKGILAVSGTQGTFVDMEGKNAILTATAFSRQSKNFCSNQCSVPGLKKAYLPSDVGLFITSPDHGIGVGFPVHHRSKIGDSRELVWTTIHKKFLESLLNYYMFPVKTC